MAGEAGFLAREKMKKGGDSASKMSALEIAAMGKYMQQMQNDDVSPVKLEMDASDADWNPLIEEAKKGGMSSWFASKVDFYVNHAKFLGKLGFSVKAGVVPLFDGAAIDMKFANLKAEKPDDNATPDPKQGNPKAHKYWVTGTGGMLVLAPTNMDNVIPVSMKKVTVTEDGVTGEAEKPITFRNKNQTVTATGIVLNKDEATLVGAKETSNGNDVTPQDVTAKITGEGVKFEQQANTAPTQTTTAATEQTTQSSALGDVTSNDVPNNAVPNNDASNNDASNNDASNNQEGDQPKDRNDQGNIPQKQNLKKRITNTFDNALDKAAKNLTGREDTTENNDDDKSNTVKNFFTDVAVKVIDQTQVGNALNSVKDLAELPEGMEVTAHIDANNFGLGVEHNPNPESDDPNLIEKKREEAYNKVTELASKALLGDKDGVEKQIGETKENVENIARAAADVANKDNITNILKGAADSKIDYDTAEERAKKAFEELKQQLDDEESEEEDSHGLSGTITLVSIPIVIPALYFAVELTPSFSYRLFANVSGENMSALYGDILKIEQEVDKEEEKKKATTETASTENSTQPAKSEEPTTAAPKSEKTVTPAQTETNTAPQNESTPVDLKNKTAKLRFSAGLRANLGLELEAKLAAGIPYIIEGAQSLFAAAKLTGDLDDDEKVLEAFAEIPITRNDDKSYSFGKDEIKAGLTGGLALSGTVGTKTYAQSKLFGWEKVMWEKTFGEWKLMALNLNLQMTKKGGSTGFFGGWGLDEASVAVSGRDKGLGKAFTDANPEGKKYGLYNIDEKLKNTEEYTNVQTNFKNAVAMLEEFAKLKDDADKALIIPKDPASSGLTDTINNMQTVLNQFIRTWAEAQLELQNEEENLDEYLHTNIYISRDESAKEKVEDHSGRLSKLEEWNKKYNSEDMEESVKTGELEKIIGFGFKRALRDKVQQQEMSFERIAEYEKKRYREVTEKSDKRIKYLSDEIQKGVKPKDYERIAKEYTSMGGNAFSHKAQLVGRVEELLSFETDQQLKSQDEARAHENFARELEVSEAVKTAKAKAREKALKEGSQDVVGEENKAGRAVFFEQYAKQLDDIRALQYGDTDSLLAYEESRLEHYSEKKKAKDKDLTPYLEADAQQHLTQSRSDEYNKELYRTATLEDLIEFERSINRGEIGDMLESYSDNNAQNLSGTELLDSIFADTHDASKKHTQEALDLFKERLDAEEPGEAAQFTTIAEMYAYTEKRLAAEKDTEKQDALNKQLRYLKSAGVMVETAGDNQEQEEISLLKGFFRKYSDAAEHYHEDLIKGNIVNLQLMRHEFNNDKGNERLAELEGLSESDDKKLDFEVLQEYLSKKGADKEKLNEFLRKKQGDNGFTPEQIRRFHASRMAESNGHLGTHIRRYSKLKQMDEEKKTYSQMIAAYQEMGGGDGYAEIIKEYMSKGKLYGRNPTDMSIQDVMKFEQDRVIDAGAEHQKLLDYLDKYENKKTFKDLLAGYEDMSNEITMSRARRFIDKHVKKQASAYEESKKDVKLTPQQMLQFEIDDKKSVGKVHMERLKKLYGRENIADDELDKLIPPSDEEEKERRKKEYLKVAKRFKNGRDVQRAVRKRVEKICSSDKLLYQELHEYEQNRKAHYEQIFQDLINVHSDMLTRIEKLKAQSEACRSVVINMEKIKNDPKDIFTMSRIAELKKVAEMPDTYADEVQKSKNEQQALINKTVEEKKKAEAKLKMEKEGEGTK